MSTLDLLDDSFPHGTPDGYRRGCRTAACPAALPCRDVYTRYIGDFSFARLINAGVPLAEILEREAAERTGIRQRDKEAARAARAAEHELTRSTSKKRSTKQPRTPKPRAAKARPPKPAARMRDLPRLIASPAPAPTPIRTAPLSLQKPHPDFAWLAGARQRAASVGDERAEKLLRELDAFQTALEGYVEDLASWRTERARRKAALRYATERLKLATTAADAGLTLDGAIADAMQLTTAQHAAAAAALAEHDAARPAPPARPRRLRARQPQQQRYEAHPRELQPHGTNACRARGCERPECIEAARVYHREWVARQQAQPIPLEHHGTPYGYQLGCKDRDTCPAEISCRDATLAEERRRARAAGIPEQAARVPAEPVRRHVRELMAAGLRVLDIADLAGVSKTGVKVLLYGRSGERKGELPSAIEAEKAQRIMALTAP